MKYTLLFISVLMTTAASAQAPGLRGMLRDLNDRTPIAGATITLRADNDSLRKYTAVSGNAGRFELLNLRPGSHTLLVSFVGYEELERQVELTDTVLNLGMLVMIKQASVLEEVVIKAPPIPVRQKEDTLEYNAAAFKVNPDANADDMIKKMPGITIENGNVKAGGEDVRKVTVDGRDFFGDDATAALRNLPAEVIDKIQVFDRMSDQARFTGFDDGNTVKAINIVTKAGMRNGQFGRLFAGYGTDQRYAAGGNVSIFQGNQRISVVGLSNNINQQNFASEDLLGLTSSQSTRGGGGGGRMGGQGGGGGRGGGGGGGGGPRFGGGTNNFMVGQQGGISKTNALGINFSDLWGKKLEVTGSYFYNNNRNTNDGLVNREFFLAGDSSQFYDENSLSSSKNNNHRLNMRLEYKIDSSNTLLFTPNISFQDNQSFNEIVAENSFKGNQITSQSISSNSRAISGYNMNNGILYRHAFPKRGRSLSLNLNMGLNDRVGETYLSATNTYYQGGEATDSLRQYSKQSTQGQQVSVNIAYTEPLGAKSQLQFSYNPSWSNSRADQQTFQFDSDEGKYSLFDSSLSNKYDNLYTTQNGGISFRTGAGRGDMFMVGIAYQHANLSGDQFFPYEAKVNRNFSNILPNLMWSKKLNDRNSLRLMYRSSTNAPSVSQLQDVIDNSNPLFLRTGNTELNQEYGHRLMARYTYTNLPKGQSFMANVFLQQTNDYIGNATYIAGADSIISKTVILYRGSQLTKPVNMDGFWSLRSFFTFGMPLKFVKSSLNWNLGYGYTNTPGIVNGVENVSNTHNYNLGAVLASNVSEYIDFTMSYTANFNTVKNSIQPALNNNYFTQSANIGVNLLSRKGWFLQNELSNQRYSGLTDGFNQNFWLWNISAGRKFLKDQRGELRASVFDLLKQNRSITRTATETYIEDVQTRVLQQYFMLTFSYRLRNFGGK